MDPVLSVSIKDWQSEASIGPCITSPQYYGLSLYPYTLCSICEFLGGKNKKEAKIVTTRDNTSSIRGITKAGFKIHREAHYLKLLWWNFSKERTTNDI